MKFEDIIYYVNSVTLFPLRKMRNFFNILFCMVFFSIFVAEITKTVQALRLRRRVVIEVRAGIKI